MSDLINNGHKLQVQDITVSYTDTGAHQRPAIVFIHGFPFNKSMWEPQVRALKAACRVLAYDVRGHGNTDAGREEFSIETFAKDLIAFLDALELEQVTLCGLSMGGYIALKALISYPERFNALILSDTQCVADTAEGRKKRMQTIEKIKKHGVEKYEEESLPNLFAPATLVSGNPHVRKIQEMICSTSRHTLSDTLLALANREETCTALSSIHVPTLILVGQEDKITPPSAARFMSERIEGSRLFEIEGAGHLPNLENTDEFNKKTLDFLMNTSGSHGNAESLFSRS